MALTVNSNIAALNAQRSLGQINSKLGKSIERLSSGLRINKASDDAAGLAIATKLGSQVRGLNQAVRNANNAITLTQTAEGGINTVTNILQRLRELAVQSASDDNTSSDRANLASEATNLTSELTRMVNTTEFNTSSLLDGSFKSKYFQVGANYSQKITFTIGDVRGKSIGGRAEYSADIADGVLNAHNANFGQSEVKFNTFGVAATASADDQYSVLNISSDSIGDLTASEIATNMGLTASNVDGGAASMNLSLNMNINGVALSVAFSYATASIGSASGLENDGTTAITGASMATDIVSAIANNASLTALNITARMHGTDGYIIERTAGGDLTILTSINVAATMSLTASTADVADSAFFSMIGAQDMVSGATSIMGNGNDLTTTTAPTIYNGQSSAIAKAAAINAIKTQSGVAATALSNEVTGNAAVGAVTLASGDLYINGQNIGAVTVTASDGTGALASAINTVTASTGVTADTDSAGKLVLTAADGRNISVYTAATTDAEALFDGGTSGSAFVSGNFTNQSAVFRGSIQLNDDSNFDITGSLGDLYDAGTTVGNNNTKTTDSSKSVAADSATYNVATLTIDTQANAESALLTIDAALDDVNTTRAQIGAVQNRLEFTVANLEIASENTASSQSRILDADFAFETAVFTRNQIMVQAATAMLAQANTLPQMALQLLG